MSRAAFGVGKVRGWGLKGFGSVCLVAGVALLAGGSVRAAPGDLDAAFGEGGVVRVPGGSFADVLIQSDGKIVAAGKGDDRFVDDGVPQQSYGSIALARYEEDGSLDPGFGSGGFVVTDLAGPQSSKAWGLLQQPDGKIVVAGHSLYPPYAHYSVVVERYLPDGTLDSTFGSAGVAWGPSWLTYSGALAAALQPDGKIVAVGWSGIELGLPVSLLLVRFDANGNLDPRFGLGGVVIRSLSSRNDFAEAVALQPDGKIVVAGESDSESYDKGRFALARFNANGSVDTTFGTEGVATTDPFIHFLYPPESSHAVVIQVDGKIVAGGQAGGRFVLARYNPDGRLDASFGEEGRVLTPFSTFLRADIATLSWMSTLALQPDGKIVAAGGTYQVNIDAVVLAAARYLSDGSLDTRFGGGGRVIMLARERDSAFGASAIALQGDGKVLVAGGSKGGEYTLARYEGGDLPRCPAALRSGCKGTPGGKGSLTIRQRASRQEDRLTWKWNRGEVTTAGELGNPASTDPYLFCLYDDSGDSLVLSLDLVAPAGGTCNSALCWRGLGSPTATAGYRYADRDLSPTGIATLTLKTGATGRARLGLEAKGENLNLPADLLPLSLPVRVQLQVAGETCWEATYGEARINSETTFKGQSD